MTSWKTSLAGLALILEAIASAAYGYAHDGTFPDIASLIAKITAGIGLLAAKDHNVTNAPNPMPPAKVAAVRAFLQGAVTAREVRHTLAAADRALAALA